MQKYRVTPDWRHIARITVGLGSNFQVGVNCDIAPSDNPFPEKHVVKAIPRRMTGRERVVRDEAGETRLMQRHSDRGGDFVRSEDQGGLLSPARGLKHLARAPSTENLRRYLKQMPSHTPRYTK
jgi:hypothetical protein